jgi:hypothetical protein
VGKKQVQKKVFTNLTQEPRGSMTPLESMTKAVFLTLGRSRSSHFKKLDLRPKAQGEAEDTKSPSATLIMK